MLQLDFFRSTLVYPLCLALTATFFSPASNAQSLEELEQQILNGGGVQSPTFEDDSTPATPQQSFEKVELPQATPPPPESRAEQDDFEVETVKASESALEEVDEIIKGPRQIPFEHIFVVQHRYIRKRKTHELVPFNLGIQPADSFRKQIQLGFSYTYNFTENWGIEALHLNALTNLKTGLNDNLRNNANLETERLEPVLSAGAALMWSPFKAKAATIGDIYHFEGYLLLGGGYTKFEDGGAAMMMGGGGVRIFLTQTALLKTEIRDYYDFASNTDHRVNVIVGAGFLLGGE